MTTHKAPSREILATFRGLVPSQVWLRTWGYFPTEDYTPEPLRCYRCQRYGHHQDRCRGPAICAICSRRHDTKVCLEKLKKGEPTTPKCPNCAQPHHAWFKRCSARISRIAQLKSRVNQPRKTPTAFPAPTRIISSETTKQVVEVVPISCEKGTQTEPTPPPQSTPDSKPSPLPPQPILQTSKPQPLRSPSQPEEPPAPKMLITRRDLGQILKELINIMSEKTGNSFLLIQLMGEVMKILDQSQQQYGISLPDDVLRQRYFPPDSR